MTQPPNQPVVDYASGGTPRPRPSRAWIWQVALVIGLIACFVVLQKNRAPATPVSLGEFLTQLQGANVKSILVERDSVIGQLAKPVTLNHAGGSVSVSRFEARLPTGAGDNWAFTEWLIQRAESTRAGVVPNITVGDSSNLLRDLLLPLIPWLFIFLIIYFFIFRQLRHQKRGTGPVEPMRVVVVNQETR